MVKFDSESLESTNASRTNAKLIGEKKVVLYGREAHPIKNPKTTFVG